MYPDTKKAENQVHLLTFTDFFPLSQVNCYHPRQISEQGVGISRMCAPGLLPLSLWGWEARSYFQGSIEEEFLSFIHFWGKTVASRQLAEDSEPDHLKQGLDTHPRVCSGEEDDPGGGVWLCKPHVPSRQSDPALCITDNQFTFPDPMLALKIHKPPFLSAGAHSMIKAIG